MKAAESFQYEDLNALDFEDRLVEGDILRSEVAETLRMAEETRKQTKRTIVETLEHPFQ